MASFVDSLADHLTQLTPGTTWKILRATIDLGHGRQGYRYALSATRGEYSYIFGARPGRDRYMNVNDMKSFVATVCDMVNMGFIPVERAKK